MADASTLEPADPVQTLSFDDVLDHVAARRQEFADQKYIPRDMIEEFKQVGIYRAATPRRFGGDARPPAEFLAMIERISAVDASAGWVASFGSALIYLAALPLHTQAELYKDSPDVVFAGGLFPVQPAEPVAGGLKITGQWKFASGCKGADILGVGIRAGESTAGKPRTALLWPKDVEIVENWDVLGLSGTGSHELKVDGVVVPEDRTFIRGGTPTVDEPLYRYPSIAYAAQVLAVVNLGVGRAALDHATKVGSGHTGITGAPKLADRAYYRIDVAKAEAALRSARAFFYEITEEAYAAVLDGDSVSDKTAALLRLASTHAAKAGAAAVHTAFQLSGTGAIYDGNPMQRYMRESLVPPQHAFLGDGIYDSAGSVLMGIPPFPGFI
ncbi:acyl-CoA dehydrogenase family protein [Nocardia sp. NPDC050793]|uniref:acyl-CoA dehydrogenase family protein n=1 Tax=Nocardia sp. NPDC050793 TaxID=3155159 RepID=UPI0033FF38C9